LSAAALKARGVPIAGVVMVGEPNADNRAAIEHYAGVPVLAELPRFELVAKAALRAQPLPQSIIDLL
jgi:malonyl-CoA O-methyltransferase